MSDSKRELPPLLPDRRNQDDFFVCDILDAAPKGDMGSMEHPIFSLSTKPDKNVRRYENNGNWLEVKPSSEGLATVHDRDVLIYCISQVISGINNGIEPNRVLRFKAYDLLKATNRTIDGRGYHNLKMAMNRLQGTQIETNIVTGGEEQIDIFSLIDRAKVIRETRDGKMLDIEVHLSDWLFNAIKSKEVLTLSRDYFRLRKPLERRIYEIGRKHCGQKAEWSISLELLRKKCGSHSTKEEFKRLLNNIVKQDEVHNHMPDYKLRFKEGNNNLFFINRRVEEREKEKELSRQSGYDYPLLKGDTYLLAKEVAPSFDVYWLEQEWQSFWFDSGKPELKSPDAAFIGFCKQRYQSSFGNPSV